MRIFFAIIPPLSIRELLFNHIEQLKISTQPNHFKWVKVESLHITLQFLGHIEPEHLPTLIEKVRAEFINTPAFQLEWGSLEWFPTTKHPKILSMSVGPHDVLTKLSSQIGQAIRSLNYPVESRPFRGHLSLGRLDKSGLQSKTALEQIQLPIIPITTITEIDLMESKPNEKGSQYSSLTQFKLID